MDYKEAIAIAKEAALRESDSPPQAIEAIFVLIEHFAVCGHSIAHSLERLAKAAEQELQWKNR